MRRSIVIALFILGCGGPPPIDPDAGSPDAGASSSIADPTLPTMTPCPQGWRETSLPDGPTVCEPAAEESCAAGTVRYAGQSACEPIGAACPSGEWPSDLPSDALYVRAGASGDGTRAAPFGSIGAALAAASSGSTIAIGPGTYDETLSIPDGVELRGTCVTQVTLTRADAGDEPVLSVARGVVRVRDLSVRSDGHLGILSSGTLHVDGVVIDAAVVGIGVLGGSLDAHELHTPHTRTDAGGRLGRAITVEVGASATVTRSVLEDSGDGAIAAAGSGSTLTLDSVAIRGTRGNGSGQFGSGVGLFDGASATVRHAEIVGAHEAGVLVSIGTLTLEDSVVRGSRSEATQGNGYGVFLRNADATLARVWIDDSQRAGLAAYEASTVSAHDVVVTSTRANDFETLGVGIGVSAASIELERAYVADSREYGVLISGEGTATTHTLSDLTIARVSEGANLGIGLGVFRSATVHATRLRVRDTTVLGVNVANEGTVLELTDADIRRIEGSAMFDFGRAIEVDVGAHATVTRARMSETRESSAVAFGEGSRLELVDVEVSAIRERACASTTCASEPGGIGVAAIGGGEVRGERVDVEGAPLCGVQVAVDGTMDLASGRIAGCAIGACVQVEGFDVARLTQSVAYERNDVNVDVSAHQVPVPIGATPEF